MKGDFLGFSFDGIHCSQLGITHVSSSDRYDEDLFPEVKDKTIEIPNNHGEYYYGSTYGTHSFKIDIAYDSVTESQFRNIRRLFGTRKVCELIFDERPYKVYYAKIENPIEMSYVCFDEPKKTIGTERDGVRRDRANDQEATIETSEETFTATEQEYTYTLLHQPVGEVSISPDSVEYIVENNTYTFVVENEDIEIEITYDYELAPATVAWEQVTPYEYDYTQKQRIYKGEGTISLICYQPFAHQLFKIKELYEEVGVQKGNLITTYNNTDEWIESSGILTRAEWNTYHIDQVISTATPYTYAIPVYNPGDLDVGFCLYIPFKTVTTEIDNETITTKEILPKDENSDIIINGDTEVLILKPIKQKNSADTGILINTRTHLIEGVSFSQVANVNDYRRPAWQTTGTLYNDCIKMGEFPYIKRNDWRLDEINNRPQAIYISCAEVNGISIYYDYLYF